MLPAVFYPAHLTRTAKQQSTEYACNADPSWLTQRFKARRANYQGVPSMRTIAIAFSAAVLAAGAAYAHGSLSSQPAQQTAGTLTCITKPEASLIFGRTPVADCTFVAERGGFRQTYAAV
jgi:hypothetical protein